MKHEITLTAVDYNPDTSEIIGISFDWNDTPHGVSFQTLGTFYANNADLIQTQDEAARWLLFFFLSLGETIETLSGKIGKKLTLDVGPAVQQIVTIT